MSRSLRSVVRELRKEAEQVVQIRAAEADERIDAWMRAQPDLHPHQALYPHEADRDMRKIEGAIMKRYHELIQASARGAVPRPPPEFMAGEPETDRHGLWLLELDPEFRQMLWRSDLTERFKRVLAGAAPSPPVHAFSSLEPDAEFEELGLVEVEGYPEELGVLILRARWKAAEMGADAVVIDPESLDRSDPVLRVQGVAVKSAT